MEFYSKPFIGFCWLVAACGGLMFGYDIGISGGVTAMDEFLSKFFPAVFRKKLLAKEDNYCKFDDQFVQLFTSSLYLSALVASFFASKCCSKYGRKRTILVSSLFCIVGVAVTASAMNLFMLIIGRVLLGVGVGFGNEAVPLFLSEIAPIKRRGGVNIMFQLLITIGILCANFVNWYSSKMKGGWRFALGLAGVPAFILFVGSLIIPETPTSLVEREMEEEGRRVLEKIRRTEDVDFEFQQMRLASQQARQIGAPLKEVFSKSNRPPLVIGISLQIFQQFTGINAIMFYAPVLFQTIGLGSDASLLSSAVTGGINVLSTLVSNFSVDKLGRRVLLLQACAQMFVSQVIIGILLKLHLTATGSIGRTEGLWIVFLVCVFVMAFAWSWGPLGWLIPSETFPLETRTIGFAFAVSSNMLCTFIIAQSFLSLLCHMKAFIFFFFAAWIIAMALFVIFLLPETKNVPIDNMVEQVWKQHWFWKRYMDDDDKKGKAIA
ncbi:Sugar transport protein 8 [Ranunculus cassubicifolius]